MRCRYRGRRHRQQTDVNRAGHMHFWIDKRSQACGYSGGRRGSLQTGIGRVGPSCSSRKYYTQAHIKLMVTPVHRFQAVECISAGNVRHHTPRAPHLQLPTPIQQQHQQQQLQQQQRLSGVRGPPPPPSYSVEGGGGGVQGSVAAAHSVELDSGVFLDAPVGGAVPPAVAPAGKLKCGMWASFAIVTVFMAGAKFYFNNQSTGMEVLIFCTLLVVVLFAGCTVSLCEAVTSPAPVAAAALVAAAAAHHASAGSHPRIAEPSSSSTQASNEDLATLQQNSTQQAPLPPLHTLQQQQQQQQQQPPPPYHVAVLLPRTSGGGRRQSRPLALDDSPPPSYEKAVG